MSLRETHHASHSYLLLNYLLLNYLLLNYSLLNYSLLNRIIFMQYFFILFSLAEACKPCVQAIQQDRRLLAYSPRVKLRETDICTDIQLGQRIYGRLCNALVTDGVIAVSYTHLTLPTT